MGAVNLGHRHQRLCEHIQKVLHTTLTATRSFKCAQAPKRLNPTITLQTTVSTPLAMSQASQTDDYPYYLREDSNITIHHSMHGTLYGTVIRPFRPRTALHLVVARLTGLSRPCPLPIGLLFVVKVFDSRFIAWRSSKWDNNPWNPDAERKGWQLYQSGPRARTPVAHHDSTWNPPQDGDEDEDIPRDEDFIWEKWYIRLMTSMFLAERATYSRLASLQGTAVPTFYGDGVLDLSGTTPQRAYNPPVVLIEYIPNAATLHDVDPRVLTEPLMKSMLDIVDRIIDLEVLTLDVNPGNFMFAPADKPTRAIAIDFGDARLRTTEDDQTWRDMVEMNCARWTVKKWMRRRFEQMGLPIPRLLME